MADAGIAFLFAPMFHPAMAHAGPVRRELRVPTVFNFLGPLTNPARPFAQAVGCSDSRMLPLMAEVLARRGTRAVLFRGEDGLDELTTTGPSTVVEVRNGRATESTLDPADLGFARASVDDLRGGDAETSAAIVRALLAGEPGPRRDVAMLNAAAAWRWREGPRASRGRRARRGGDRLGSGRHDLDRWVAASRSGSIGDR